MEMRHTLRRGLLAGLFAGLVLAMLDFVTDGALVTGLALGVLWWFVFELVLTNIMNHASSPFSLSFGRFLSSFPLDVLFGVLLGAVYIQWQGRHATEAS